MHLKLILDYIRSIAVNLFTDNEIYIIMTVHHKGHKGIIKVIFCSQKRWMISSWSRLKKTRLCWLPLIVLPLTQSASIASVLLVGWSRGIQPVISLPQKSLVMRIT